MNYSTLLVEKADGVALITLNRPEKRNAMSPQLHADMTAALEALRYDDEARVVVITGAPPAFCAGLDLKEMFIESKSDPATYDRVVTQAIEWRGRTLRYYPKTTIAMINGYCFGGAFAIVEGCDLAFAADDATFGLSEINFKLFPGGAVSKALANLFRPRDALYYALTGENFDGRQAAEMGFINKSFPEGDLRERTMDVARRIAAKDPMAQRVTKQAYRYSLEMSWEAAMDYALAKEQELQLIQKDAWRTEGIGQFLEGKYRPGLEDVAAANGKEQKSG